MQKENQTSEKVVSQEFTTAELKAMLAQTEAKEQKELKNKQLSYVKKKDEFIELVVDAFKAIREDMQDVKEMAYRESEALNEEMYTIYDRKRKKDQKSYSIVNEKKTKKVEIKHSDNIDFDETANVGIELMHEVLKDKFETRNKGMYKIIDKLLSRNAKGDYKPQLLIELRSFESEINNPNFTKALEILTKAQIVTSTSLYIRTFEKNDKGKWEDISLQFSSI